MKNELTIKEQIEKFNRLYSTYITQDISELSKSFDKCFFEENTDGTLKLIKKANKIKENSLTLANKMQLNYDIATAYSDLRNIDHVLNSVSLHHSMNTVMSRIYFSKVEEDFSSLIKCALNLCISSIVIFLTLNQLLWFYFTTNDKIYKSCQ